MKNCFTKIAACILVASMSLPLASCKKNESKGGTGESSSGKKIEADTPWFDSRVLKIDPVTDPDRSIDVLDQSMLGCDDEKIIILTTGTYSLPESVDWNSINMRDYNIFNVTVVDRNSGKTIRSINMLDGLDPKDNVNSAKYSKGKIYAQFIKVVDDVTGTYEYYENEYDPLTGTVTDTHSYNPYQPDFIHSVVVNGYSIDAESVWNADANEGGYILHITSPDGKTNDVDLTENNPGLSFIYFFAEKDDKTVVIPAKTDVDVFYELDLTTMNITKADAKEYEWLDLSKSSLAVNGSDGFVYAKTSDGILKLNFEKKMMEEYFNFSYCGINRNTLEALNISDVNGDTIMLSGNDSSTFSYAQTLEKVRFTAIELTKAAKNPHAGKTILELYSATEYSTGEIGQAILKFNETNGSYYIVVTNRYDPTDYTEMMSATSNDDYFVAELNSNSKLSDKLAIDIMNGDGPDILLNVGSFGQLCNSNYLADLTPFVGNLDSSKYFTNVIDISKNDGKLYNLPICFTINGIQTSPDNAGASGVGFTTAEYEKFLKSKLNGEDIITYGQAYYFAKVFNGMSDKFIKNGKADFSGPEFAELARFVKENVRERAVSWGDFTSSYQNNSETEAVAITTQCFGAGGYLPAIAQYWGATAILGYPSADGRGPLLAPYISVSVSAQAADVNACGEFVKILLSDDIQTSIAMSNSFVLNRAAFRKGSEAALDYFNGAGYNVYFGGGSAPDHRVVFSPNNIDDLEKIIMTCSGIDSVDGPISMILIEEMPSYFSGQKDLASVVKIAQDRAQKVLDERG